MREHQFKPFVKRFLKQFGFDVHDIPIKNDPETPDFEVIGKNDKYTIELKIKEDDPTEIEEDSQAQSRGELVTKSIPIGPRNRLSGIIRKGVNQMVEHDPKGDTFRVIWLHSSGRDPDLHNRRFHSTLYGIENLFSLRLSNLITCYYFHESAFYSWRAYLDGAILTYGTQAQICINTLSPRVEQFRKSELVTCMSEGLCDPDKLAEQDDEVMVADCDVDRSDSDAVIRYLQKKYALDHLQPIPMQQHSAMISLPTNEES